jgi:hypothetical protein
MLKLLQRLIQLFMKGGKTPGGRMIARDISKSQRLKQFQTMLETNSQYRRKYQALMQQGKAGRQEQIKFLKDYVAGRKKMTDYVKPSKYDKKWGINRDYTTSARTKNIHGGEGSGGW